MAKKFVRELIKKGSKNWSKKWSKNSPIVQGSNSPVQIYTMSKSGTLGET